MSSAVMHCADAPKLRRGATPTSPYWERSNSPEKSRKIGFICRVDVGIDPYAPSENVVHLRERRHARKSLRRWAQCYKPM